ncbi:hypothetical protein [Sporisorium scitamineum]|uniref:Uncharacterized protein n=1 Tax=Sporisorium scitamineum TaxID=49012 RepID=A0A0F7S2Y1_9BASI|nr:hypothetical protein [Sporisorium scitamineum]
MAKVIVVWLIQLTKPLCEQRDVLVIPSVSMTQVMHQGPALKKNTPTGS